MPKNNGKRFEQDFVASLRGLDDVSVDRFFDAWQMRKNVANVSDYVAYRYPHQFYFECKSYQGDSIPLSALSHKQHSGLLQKSKIYGVVAGAVLNFRLEGIEDEPQTYFMNIKDIEQMRLNGLASINLDYSKAFGVRVDSQMKRTRYKYDALKLLQELSMEDEPFYE
jgi:penicillin-binding protein-related factor A (putative recombinase)